jgi:uncharacterized protein with HEPN domain
VCRRAEFFLFDIYVAILKIEWVSSKYNDPFSLRKSFVEWDSVIREFEIIGEATRRLIQYAVLNKEFKGVVGFRNVIVHEYFGIDPEEVWNVIHRDLPSFKETICSLIMKIDLDLRKELVDAFVEENKHLDFIVSALKDLG